MRRRHHGIEASRDQGSEAPRGRGGDAAAASSADGARPGLVWLRREQFGWSIVAALAFALSFPTANLWPLIVLSPAALAIAAARAGTLRETILPALVSHFLMWMWIQRWMIDISPPGWPLLALCLSVYPALFVALIQVLRRTPATRVPMYFAVPVLWTGLEYVRGSLFMDGYPWYLLGQPFIEWPLLVQSADTFGIYGISFLVAMLGGLAADVYLGATARFSQQREAARGSHRLLMPAGAVIVAILWGGNILYGSMRLAQAPSVERSGPTVLAIQTNLPQTNKQAWQPEQQVEDFTKFCMLTIEALEAAETGEVDLVVWPETMAPGPGFEPDGLAFMQREGYFPGNRFLEALLELRRRYQVPFLVGSSARLGLGVQQTPEGPKWTWTKSFNSAYMIDRDGPPFERYDKVFLTPFGETMPYISKWPWLEEKLLSIGARGMSFDLDAAEEIRRLSFEYDGGRITLATPICFEDTVPALCRRMVYEQGEKRVDLLINLSNDGWFGSHDAGRLQHLQIARFRSIENRVPMVRAVNTGVSALIDGSGNIIVSAREDRHEFIRSSGGLKADVRLDGRIAPYSAVGDLLPQMCLFLIAAGILLIALRARRGGRPQYEAQAARTKHEGEQ